MILAVKFNRIHFSWVFVVPLFLLFVTGCEFAQKQPEQVVISGPTMGTSYTLKLIPESPIFSKEKLHQKVETRLGYINKLMSTYDPDSELSRFNRSQSREWFPIAKETLQVIEASISISDKTEGAFDFTLADLVELWGFGTRNQRNEIPDKKIIQNLLKSTGYQKVELRVTPRAIRKHNPSITLDLSAIAKGFAVDEISKLLMQEGVNSFLVEIGGELKSRGNKGGNQPWLVAIEKPIDRERSIGKIISLQNQGMATSGDYRNFFTLEGKRFSHTLNPLTGKPVTHNLASVSVIHSSTMNADAWATAFMVMGPEKGIKVAQREGLAVLFTVRDQEGHYDLMTEKFKTYINPL